MARALAVPAATVDGLREELSECGVTDLDRAPVRSRIGKAATRVSKTVLIRRATCAAAVRDVLASTSSGTPRLAKSITTGFMSSI